MEGWKRKFFFFERRMRKVEQINVQKARRKNYKGKRKNEKREKISRKRKKN